MAADYGHLEIFKFILDKIEDYADEFGDSPLHYAVQSGHLEMWKFIIDNMEDQNRKRSDRKTPLELATEMGHEKVCKLLKEDRPKNIYKLQ